MTPVEIALAVVPFIAATATWVRSVETRFTKQEERDEQEKTFREDVKTRFNRLEDKLDRVIEKR